MSAGGETPRTFSARMVAALVLISAFSLLAVMALSAYAPELRSTDNPEANAFSKSAIGFSALLRLLQDCDIPVKISRGAAHEQISQASLTILAPTLANSASQLREAGLPGARLFILPKWTAMPDPLRSDWVMKVSTLETKLITGNILDPLTTKSALSRRAGNVRIALKAPLPSFHPEIPPKTGKIDSLQTISGPGLSTLVRDAKGDAVLAQIAGTQTYILADPDLMNTQGIHDLSTARAAVALIQQMRVGNGPVVFDVTLNGYGSSPNFFGLAFRPPFLGATICALLTAFLIGLHAMSRFGTPAAPPPAFALGKEALAGNTADLIRVMGREPAMARRYAQVTRNIVLRAAGVRRDLSAEQVQILFKGLERDLPAEERFAALAAESAQPSTRAHMLGVAQRLYQWRRGSHMNIEEVGKIADAIRAEIAKAVIGQTDTVDLMLTALFAGGHVLLEGPPGTAKTLLVQSFGKTLSLDFGRIQFTPDLMPGDIIGTNVFNFQTSTFAVNRGPIFCELLLADEINRTPPKTQAALLEAMQERRVTLDGKSNPLSDRFMVVATENPIEQQGTYPLPEAQLDRFLFKHVLAYPSEEEEHAIVATNGPTVRMPDPTALGIAPVLSREQLAPAIATVAEARLTDGIISYVVAIVRATRLSADISHGASPRSAAMLAAAARARAALEGRDYVIPDDVKALALPTLRHRIVLSPAAEIDGRRVDDVVKSIVDAAEAPR